MPTFSSTEAIENYISSRIPVAIEIVVEKIKNVIEEVLASYYGEYDPRLYQRTGQLMNSVRVEMSGKRGVVYIDTGNWHHILDEWSEEDILNDAMLVGSHGGSPYATSQTPVWTTAMGSMDVIKMLKDALIAAGVPVK